MERGAQRNRANHGRLAVILVVEGADAAPSLEAVRVADGPVVHLGALLLTVVDDVETRTLLESQGVQAGPPLDLGFLLFIERCVVQEVDQPLILRNLKPLAPGTGLLELAITEWLAGVGLDPPRRLVERADLVGQQWLVIEDRAHTDTSSFALRATSPSRRTFCSATPVGRYCNSQFDER